MSEAFNTLEYTKGAIKVGIPREQAEYQAEQLSVLIYDKLVTKRDLKELELNLFIKLGGLVVICSSLVVGVLGFIIKFN
jgi:hypothetical protein